MSNEFSMFALDVTDVPTIWTRIALAMLHSLWIGAAIGLAALAMYLVLRRGHWTRVKYAVLVVALFATAVSPVMAYIALAPPTMLTTFENATRLPDVELAGEPVFLKVEAMPTAEELASSETDPPAMRLRDEANMAYVPVQYAPEYSESNVMTVVRAEDSVAWGKVDAATLPKAVVLLYAAVAFLLLVRLAVGIAGGSRLRQRSELIGDGAILSAMVRHTRSLGMKITPAIAYCNRVAVPTVVGIVRPMILLPIAAATGMNPEQVEYLILHELAHIRRYDHVVNLLQRIIEAVMFYHPVVWLLSRQIRIEREHCCDDLVVRLGGDAQHYAESLLAAASLANGMQLRGAVPAIGATGKASHLRHRVARILGEPAPAVRLRYSGWMVTTICAFVCVFAVAQLQSEPQLRQTPTSGRPDATANAVDPVAQPINEPSSPQETGPNAQSAQQASPVSPDAAPESQPALPVQEAQPDIQPVSPDAASSEPSNAEPQQEVESDPNAIEVEQRIELDNLDHELELEVSKIRGVQKARAIWGTTGIPERKYLMIEVTGKSGIVAADLNDELKRVQASALAFIKEYGTEELKDTGLLDGENFIRFQFIPSYGPKSPPNMASAESAPVGELQVQLTDKDWWLRKLAVQQLAATNAKNVWMSIVPVLHDEDVRVKAAAATALGELRDPGAIKHLVAALKESGEPADAAAKALAKFDPALVMPLVRMAAEDEDLGVQLGAIKALREVRSPEAADMLIGILGQVPMLGDERPTGKPRSTRVVRESGLRAMLVGDSLSDELGRTMAVLDAPVRSDLILRASQHTEWRVRAGLMKVLAMPKQLPSSPTERNVSSELKALLNQREIVEAQANAMRDEQSDVRVWAASGLGHAYAALDENPELTQLREQALIAGMRDQNLQIRWLCVELLFSSKRGSDWSPANDDDAMALHIAGRDVDAIAAKGSAAVPSLIAAMKADPSFPITGKTGTPWSRNFIAQALAKIGGPDVVEPLLAMLDSADYDTASQICQALGEIGDPRAVEPLMRMCSSASHDVQMTAISALGKLKDVRAFDTLVSALTSSDGGAKNRAVTSLGQLGDKRATAILAAMLEQESKLDLRETIVNSLGELGDPAALPQLISELKGSTGAQAPRDAAEALGKVGGAEARDALLAALRTHSESEVRGASAWALGAMKDPAAITSLAECLGFDREIYKPVADALAAIGTPEAIQALHTVFVERGRRADNVKLAEAILDALIDTPSAETSDVLYALLHESMLNDPELGVAAASALAIRKDTRAIEFLEKLREVSSVRLEAERALATLNGQAPASPAPAAPAEVEPAETQPTAGQSSNSPRLQVRLVLADEEAEGKERVSAPTEAEPEQTLALADDVWITEADVESVQIVPQPGDASSWTVNMTVTDAAAERMRQKSSENVGRKLAVVYDGKVISAPTLRAEIGKSISITGDFKADMASAIARAIAPESGAAAATEKNLDKPFLYDADLPQPVDLKPSE